MKSVLSLFITASAVISFAGCYTELATVERNDSEYAYDSDTLYEEGNTTINNHYYLDDEYRRSRFRVSFHYYYPTYTPWISSYYYSYFNDPYWGMYHRPLWYYDPWGPYYPPYGWCYYPSPYYDPWYPYYPPVIYYPGYYPTPIYANNPAAPDRPRTGGSTRDPNPNDRSRPIPSTPPVTEPPTTGINTAVRHREPVEPLPVGSTDRGRTPEKPWWDKMKEDRQVRVADETRPGENTPVNNPSVNERKKTVEDQPIERPKGNRPAYTPPKRDRPAERSKREEPSYTPPVKKSVPKDDARPVERSRETRRPSYSPPPQSAPPQSSPPRSSGGSSSQSGSDRKRD